MSNFNPYAAPTTADAPPAYYPSGYQADEAPLAGRGARFGAALIDGLISLAIMLPLQINFGVLANFPKIKPLGFGETAAWAVAGFVLWTALHSYFLATRGQTIGKRLVGVQIVNVSDGRPAPLVKVIFARFLPTAIVANIPYVGGVVNLVGILLIFRDDRRCLHDLIAGTKVVEYRAPDASSPA
ncbi:hypothetical protein BH11MYX4_BH11MYX4_52240 [soil metagenome]